MTKEDFESGRLVFDVSAGGCGKRKYLQSFRKLTAISSARRVLQDVVLVRGKYNVRSQANLQKSRGTASTCVWCRAPWAAPAPQAKGGIAHTKAG